MGFAALADLKAQLNITDTTQDAELQTYLDASGGLAEVLIGAGSVTTYTELYGTFDGRIVLMRRPLVGITSVTPLNGVVLLSSAYTVDTARNGLTINGGGANDYTVVYTAGWSSSQTQQYAIAKLAQMIVAQHLWRTQRGGMVPSVVDDSQLVTLPGTGFAIPARAAELFSALGGPAMIPGIA